MLIRVLIIVAMLVGAMGGLPVAANVGDCAECDERMAMMTDDHSCNEAEDAGKSMDCDMQCMTACQTVVTYATLSAHVLIGATVPLPAYPKEATSWRSRITDFEAPPPRV